MDSEVGEMLRELGPTYEEYITCMEEFVEYQEIYDDKNLKKLQDIIEEKSVLQKVIEEARKLDKQKQKSKDNVII